MQTAGGDCDALNAYLTGNGLGDSGNSGVRGGNAPTLSDAKDEQ